MSQRIGFRRKLCEANRLLDRVEEELGRRDDTIVAGKIVDSGTLGEGWIETVSLIVASTTPIYDIARLNRYMAILIRGVRPTSVDQAYPYDRDGGIHLGQLYFDEVVGVQKEEITTEITAVQPDVLERARVATGLFRRTQERELRRRTWVRPYPDTTVAQIVAEYERGIHEGSVEPNSDFGLNDNFELVNLH